MGSVKDRSDYGVLDHRVQISENAYPCELHGFTLTAVAGRRILWEANASRILLPSWCCDVIRSWAMAGHISGVLW